MKDNAKFSLRIPQTLHKKLKVMAEYDGRSENKEIEMAIKRLIRDFEVLHGNIDVD